MGRDNPWYDPNDTVTHTFTAENGAPPSLQGQWIEIYAELSEAVLDALETSMLTGVREDDSQKGKRELMLDAKGLSVAQVAAWLKSWSGLGRNAKPSEKALGDLKRSAFKAIQVVVQEHAKAAIETSEPILDPTPPRSGIAIDGSPTSDALASTNSSVAPPPPTHLVLAGPISG